MDPITLAILGIGSFLAYRSLVPSATGAAAAAAGAGTAAAAAPVPPAQAGTSESTGAAAVAGSMSPVPPLHTRAKMNHFFDRMIKKGQEVFAGGDLVAIIAAGQNPITANTWVVTAVRSKRLLKASPWPDASGIWRNDNGSGGDGELHQFHDCAKNPIGQPGYLPLEIKARFETGLTCHGKHGARIPDLTNDFESQAKGAFAQIAANAAAAAAVNAGGSSASGVTAGQVVAQAAAAIGDVGSLATTASAVAGAAAAASSGAGVAGTVAAAGAAALACLGPVPSALCWR